MYGIIWFLSGFAAATAIAWLFRRHGLQTIRLLEKEKEDLLTEETRVFSFLHELGDSLSSDRGLRRLHQEIVDGIARVVGADGAALYLVDARDSDRLAPAAQTASCLPVIQLPGDRLNSTPAALASWLSMTSAPAATGLTGRCFSQQAALHTGTLQAGGAWTGELGASQTGAAMMFSPVTTGSRKLGIIAVVQQPGREPFSAHAFEVFRSAAEQSAFALANAMNQQEASAKRRIDEELRSASEVQRILLPSASPEISGYSIAATNVPARVMSGDYYDFIPLGSGRTGVVIADVSGKGFPASLVMATCRALVRGLCQDKAPTAALGLVNRQLWDDMREDMFISMAYCILDAKNSRITLSRAGHDAPLLYSRATGTVQPIKPPGLALGVDSGRVFDRVTRDFDFTMEPGDCLLLYTDGVNEAENPDGVQYGMERLITTFANTAPLGADHVLQAFTEDVREFSGTSPQSDDITIIVIQRTSDSGDSSDSGGSSESGHESAALPGAA